MVVCLHVENAQLQVYGFCRCVFFQVLGAIQCKVIVPILASLRAKDLRKLLHYRTCSDHLRDAPQGGSCPVAGQWLQAYEC